jgi:hypothetical protein
MQEATDKRNKIVKDFAKWAALSALRSGSPLKSRQAVYGLLENHANLKELFDSTCFIDQPDFDDWHKGTVLVFVKAEPALKRTNQVGWAAKIINVYLKTRVYLAGEGRDGLLAAIHPPIDSGLVKGLKKSFPERPWMIKQIKNVHSYEGDYFPFIEECRSLAKAKGFLPIEVEYYWQGAEAPSGNPQEGRGVEPPDS